MRISSQLLRYGQVMSFFLILHEYLRSVNWFVPAQALLKNATDAMKEARVFEILNSVRCLNA